MLPCHLDCDIIKYAVIPDLQFLLKIALIITQVMKRSPEAHHNASKMIPNENLMNLLLRFFLDKKNHLHHSRKHTWVSN